MSGEGQITTEPSSSQVQPPASQEVKGNVEAKTVGANSVGRKAEEINAEFADIKKRGNKEEAEEFLSDEGRRNLFIADHPELIEEEDFKDGVTKISLEGQDRAIRDVKIDENNSAVYKCKVDGIDGYIEVPREVIKNILLVEKRNMILNLFSGDERKAVEDYMSGLVDGSIPLSTSWRTEELQEQKAQEKSPEDIVISRYRKSFEDEFKKAEERGDVPKDQMEKIEETLILLRLAEEANGDAGVIFKHIALKNLAEEHAEQGLDNVIDTLQEKVPAAIDKVCELMDADKALEFRNAIEDGKLEDLVKSGKLLKVEGMRELLFGKDFTEEKLKEILRVDKKKKWKDPFLLALIILLIGPMELGKEVVPMPGSGN